jgi:ferredoxin
MDIDTESESVRQLRSMSLELLLSDHRADCEAPCRVACPAGFDVAGMNRRYDAGEIDGAREFLRDGLVIPATLCYICNAPCERVCRRKDLDVPVGIREIKKQLVAGTRLDAIVPAADNGRRVAVAGSSPACLSAAYRLRRLGYGTTVFERGEAALVPYIDVGKVPAATVALELEAIERSGVRIVTSCGERSFGDYDGLVSDGVAGKHPCEAVIAARSRQPARLVLEGFRAAEKLAALLSGDGGDGVRDVKQFGSTYGRFSEAERQELSEHPAYGKRSGSCLHCDCERKTDCRLRDCATLFGIKSPRYSRDTSLRALERRSAGAGLGFEETKCIRCGLCVYNSENGFTFTGRGFDMRVALPPGNEENVSESLTELCPTGALYAIQSTGFA